MKGKSNLDAIYLLIKVFKQNNVRTEIVAGIGPKEEDIMQIKEGDWPYFS